MAVGEEPILEAAEIGPVTDANAIYEAVMRMRPFLLKPRSVGMILGATLIPVLPVYTVEIPIKAILQKLAGAIV
jgi:hypothetical protein